MTCDCFVHRWSARKIHDEALMAMFRGVRGVGDEFEDLRRNTIVDYLNIDQPYKTQVTETYQPRVGGMP